MILSHKIATEQFRTLDPSVRLIVVHPNFVQQHRLLSFLLQNGVYIRLQGVKLNRTQLRTQLDEAIRLQREDQSLDGLDYLVIDEGDRAVETDLLAFLTDLLPSLKTGRIVLFSRLSPLVLMEGNALRRQTRFIPNDESMMLWDYAQRSDSGGVLLEVRSLGMGRVHLNGQSVDQWDGVLPRSLFFYLVDRGMATRNEIFETFWPNLTVREATNVFHVTKRKISEVLGIDLTVHWSGFYHISPRIQLSYDVSLFTQMINDSAVSTPEASIDLLRGAIALYRGDFLSTLDLPWVVRRREDLLQMCGEALIALARTTESLGSQQQALGLYLRASVSNLQREDVAQSIMRLYRDTQRYNDALRVYRRLERELRQSLNVTPAPHLQELAREIEDQMRASGTTE